MILKFNFFSKFFLFSLVSFSCFSADEKYVFFVFRDISNAHDLDSKIYTLVSEKWAKSSFFKDDLEKMSLENLTIDEFSFLDLRELMTKTDKNILSYTKNEIYSSFSKKVKELKKKNNNDDEIFMHQLMYFHFFFFSKKTPCSFAESIIKGYTYDFQNIDKKQKQNYEKFVKDSIEPIFDRSKKFRINLRTLSKTGTGAAEWGTLIIELGGDGKNSKGKINNKYIYFGLGATLLIVVGGGAFFLLASKEKDEEKKN